MRVAVTGGSGQLGQHVVAALEPDHEVTVLDRRGEGERQPLGPVDLLDLEQVARALAGQDAVVHLGGLDAAVDATEEQFFRTNTLAAWNVMHAGFEAGVRVFSLCSSTSAYGFSAPGRRSPPDHIPIDESHRLRASDAYGLSKRALEEIGRGFAERDGVCVSLIRPCYIAFDAVLPRLLRCKHGETGAPGARFEEPMPPLRWVVAPEDVASCFRLAVEVAPKLEAFNVSADSSFSSIPVREQLRVVFGQPVPERDPARFDENPFASLLDTTRARAVLGWRPQADWSDLEARAIAQVTGAADEPPAG